MLSLATSDVHAVRSFGIGAAVGVMTDLAISIVLVPTLLAFVPKRTTPPPQERWLLAPMRRVAAITSRRPGLVLGVAGLIALVSIGGILRLRVDTNHINFFASGHPLSQSARLIDDKLSGVYGFQVFFEGPAESLREPGVLARVDALGKEIGRLANVRSVISLADYVKRIDRDLARLNDQDPVVERLLQIPGVGPLTATALRASVVDIQRFPTGRHFSSWLGLTSREHSSGQRRRLGRISKQGDPSLRTLLIHGARAVLLAARSAQRRGSSLDRLRTWALDLQERRGHNKAAVALANKLARIVWATWRHERDFTSKP
jgi:hypothetical protein